MGVIGRARLRFGALLAAVAGVAGVPIAGVVLSLETAAAHVTACPKKAVLGGLALRPRDKPPGPAATNLARRYAPTLQFDSDELFLPSDRAMLVRFERLWLALPGGHLRKCAPVLVDGDPLFERLPNRRPVCPARFPDCHYYVQLDTLTGRSPSGPIPFVVAQNKLARAKTRTTVYWHYSHADRSLQYWIFYPFNFFSNWHGGDWEQITIAFDRTSGKPKRIGYSSHHNGQSRNWVELVQGRGVIGVSPVVFVARGSHANYFSIGSRVVVDCPKALRRVERFRLRFCIDRNDGNGLRLGPTDYALRPLDGSRVYVGDYGSGNFVATPVGPLAQGKQVNVSDPQTRGPTWDRPSTWLMKTDPVDIAT